MLIFGEAKKRYL